MIKNALGWILAILVPSTLTLGFGKLAEKYHNNGYFIFPKESRIALKSPRFFGYGSRPMGKIIGYEYGGPVIGDQYLIEMTTDKDGNYDEWLKTGKVEGNPERVTKIQTHFKWNIENHFKRA